MNDKQKHISDFKRFQEQKDAITIEEKIRMSKRTIEMYQGKIDKYKNKINEYQKEIVLETDNLTKLYIEAGYEQIRCYHQNCKTSFFINPNEDTSFYKCPKCKQILDPNEYVIPF